MTKSIALLLILISGFYAAQMPNISQIWLNSGKAYLGIIGNRNEVLKLKIEISEQDKKNDQEYFVSGFSVVETSIAKFEGKLKIKKYKDSGKKGVVYGDYELAEEQKGKHSGIFSGKFTYTFKWNKTAGKIENQKIIFSGNWKSYDGTLNLKTQLKNQ